MSECAAKLRRDLVVSLQSSRDQHLYVVKDPSAARFFRMGNAEYSIARLLDGTRSLEEIRKAVEAETGAILHPRTLEQFIERLRRLGLLEEAGTEPREIPHQPRRRGSALYYRCGAFDPSRLLDLLAPWTRPLFTPFFLVLSVVLVLLATWISFAHASDIGRDIWGLWRIQSLAIAWGIVFLVITAHEFAHALTVRHFGGRVQEMGLILIYFQPTFYSNVSDAWLFPEKSRRLWVTFAGAWFELLVWAMATLTWRVTEAGSWPARFSLVILATSGIRTLFNLNPLIKLDGYYLLSDWLEVPNLRGKAFAYLRSWLGTPIGGRREREESGTGRVATAREKRIYIVYGLLASVYSFALLALVTHYFGGYLVRSYQGWGFVIFLCLLGVVFRAPLTGALGGVTSMFAGRKNLKRTVVRVSKLLAVGVPLGLVLFFGRLELKISGEFRILPAHNADVRAEVEGIVQEIYVEEGSTVQKGEPIALLSDRDYKAEGEKVRAEIAEKQANLRMLLAGPRAEEIQLAMTAVGKAEERIRFAREQLDRLEPLYGEKILSRKELEDAREQVAVRQKELEEANGRLDVLRAGSRPEEVEALEAEISRLTTQRRYLSDQLSSVKVVSPIAGVVTSRNLKEKVGEALKKGDLIAKVHELGTVTAEIAVPEVDISDVKVGERVTLRARAYPESTFEGTVAAISPTATQADDTRVERTVIVTTRLENAEGLLKSEMTGNAKIHCGERRAIDIVTRRIRRYVRVEFWSWW